MKAIGVYIKQKRELAGYSLKKLASLCGISSSELHKIENGSRQNPNWTNLCKIANSLEIHPFEFLLEAGCITETDITPAHRIKRLDKLSDNEIELVQLYIDFLIARRNGSLKGLGEDNDL
ncbi:MAG: helix-turn-helix transcriptional regulator [Oscillospiraceae bacterium]|nr:helix-turn-helix transcriptional regulator [Oscillospiraceae bacterium]